MKKLLTLAVAAAIVAPMAVSADTTVYGRVNTALVNVDNGTAGSDQWDVANQASRFGVKGSEDLGNGLKAIFQYEWGVDSSDTGNMGDDVDAPGRLAFVGLTGGFGTVAIGRQWTPYYGAVNKSDVFNLGTFNDMDLSTGRTGNALAYVSPNFSGFSGALAFVIDNGNTTASPAADTEDTVDATNLGLNYNNGPLSVGFGYHSVDQTDDDRWGLSAKYNFGAFALIGQYEEREVASVDSDALVLTAEAYFGNNTIRAYYGEQDTDGAADMDEWAIGFQHNFSKRTRVYAEYGSQDNGAASADEDVFGVGLRHDF